MLRLDQYLDTEGNDHQSIDDALEQLYSESVDDKLAGVTSITTLLVQDPNYAEDIVENSQLMSALSRLLAEAHQHPIDLTFGIAKIFLSISLIEDYHEILVSNRVGASLLSIVELELQRAESNTTSGTTKQVTASITFTNKQTNVVFVCLATLNNLSDEYTILRKMMKKSLVQLLVRCVNQHTPSPPVLSLLKKASIFEETAVELSKPGCTSVISQLIQMLNTTRDAALQQEIIITLFNLTFHDDCTALISAENNIHARLVALSRSTLLCTQTFQLMYHLSSSKDGCHKLYEAGITSHLLGLLTHTSSDGEIDEGFVGLLVNMTLHPLCCEELICHGHGAIDQILGKMIGTTRQVLLKVARHLSAYTRSLQCKLSEALEAHADLSPLVDIVKSPQSYIHTETSTENSSQQQTSLYWDKHFWSAHVDLIIQRAVGCFKCANDDLLVEWLGILSNLTRDDLQAGVTWYDLLEANHSDLSELFLSLLDPSCQDDVKLELILLLGELCHSSECINWIASNNLIDVLHGVFTDEEQQDDEVRLQILSAYERLMYYDVTRFQVMGGDGVVDTMLACLSLGDASLLLAAEKCLILIEDCDRDEDGTAGRIGLDIIHRRYTELCVEDDPGETEED